MSLPEVKLPPIPGKLIKLSSDGRNITYDIGQKLGKGGFGVVHEAYEEENDRKVALKCICKEQFNDDSKLKKKILQEIDIHRNLHNENIVDFLGVFQDDDYIYIVLELCSKGNMLDLLRKSPPFSERKTAKILRHMLDSLEYIHKNGIVHHDIKLQNYLINDENTIKLADFGLSVNINRKRKHKHTSICGTPGYIPPEVVERSQNITPAVDIWSLGVCTFLMLTARQPFNVGDRKETYEKIKNLDYKFPEKPVLSDEAKSFIESIFQKDPAKRPTAESLLKHPFIARRRRKHEKVNNKAEQDTKIADKKSKEGKIEIDHDGSEKHTERDIVLENENKEEINIDSEKRKMKEENEQELHSTPSEEHKQNIEEEKKSEQEMKTEGKEEIAELSKENIEEESKEEIKGNIQEEKISEPVKEQEIVDENKEENNKEQALQERSIEADHISEKDDQDENEKPSLQQNEEEIAPPLPQATSDQEGGTESLEKTFDDLDGANELASPLSKQIPIVNSIDEKTTTIHESEFSMRLPQIAVKMWCDYTSKYGFAYIMYNGLYGALFNDSSQLAMNQERTYVQYWEKPQLKSHKTYYFANIEQSPIKKKMLIMQKLATELKKRSQVEDINQSDDSDSSDSNPYEIEITRVKGYFKNDDGIIFQLNNKDIQANFKDRTKIYLQYETKSVFFSTPESTVQIPITELEDKTKHPEVRAYLHLVKKMATQIKI